MKFLYIFSFLFPFASLAQVSVLQDKSGESSVLINGSGVFVNTGDESISGAFSFGRGVKGRVDFFGINVKAKSTEGVTTITDGDKFKAQFDVSLYYLHVFPSSSNSSLIHQAYILGSHKNANYNVLKDTTSTNFNEYKFNGSYLTVGYNHYNAFEVGSLVNNFLFGIAVSYGKFSNINALDEVKRYSVNSSTSGASTTNVLRKQKGGFEGEYLVSSGPKLAIDAYIYPGFFDNRNVGIGGFLRTFNGDKFTSFNRGFGFVIGNPSAPDEITLGLFLSFNRVDGKDRKTISLTAGYNF